MSVFSKALVGSIVSFALFSVSAGMTARADVVTFRNTGNTSFELHVRNGPVDQNPDNRGSKNTTMKAGDSWDDDVGSGDTWFAYGNQQVFDKDNPKLCHAAGGTKVNLDKSQVSYVDN
jgi:hypothetical protein